MPLCVCMFAWHTWHLYKRQKTALTGVSYLLPTSGSLGPVSGHQVWKKEPLPTGPSPLPFQVFPNVCVIHTICKLWTMKGFSLASRGPPKIPCLHSFRNINFQQVSEFVCSCISSSSSSVFIFICFCSVSSVLVLSILFNFLSTTQNYHITYNWHL